jgi:hypothetical protein
MPKALSTHIATVPTAQEIKRNLASKCAKPRSADPDAELLAIIAEFFAADELLLRNDSGDVPDPDADVPIEWLRQWNAAAQAITPITAHTDHGRKEKCRAAYVVSYQRLLALSP